MISKNLITIPAAINKLFKVRLAEHKAFKDLVYPLVRSKGFLDIKKEKMVNSSTKDNIYITQEGLAKLHNAIILQAFFSKTKKVKDIFSKPDKRIEAAEILDSVLSGRQALLDVSINSLKFSQLIAWLKSTKPLDQEGLPNPFSELPQLSLNGTTSVMQSLLAQSGALTNVDNMMMYFINDQLKEAYDTSLSITSTNPLFIKYQTLVQRKYNEANEFDTFLENLLK
ncbi:hypothetical protein ACVFI8_10895 [Agarivorans sp. MS3-6]